MPLITWAYRPALKVQPGTISIGWTLSSSNIEVRWFLAPLESGYPNEYLVGTTSAQFQVTNPGMYIFHLEAKDPTTGETEERVVMFEVVTSQKSATTSPIRLSPSVSQRNVNMLQTYEREVPFRGKPDSHDENKWIQTVIEDIHSLAKRTAQLEIELKLRTLVSTIEAAALESAQKRRHIQLAAKKAGSNVQTIIIEASQFKPGMPVEAGTEDKQAIVDPVFGEIAPALAGMYENKLGWPTKNGLKLPSTISVITSPHEGNFTENDPRNALDGIPQTAWMREIYVPTHQSPEPVIYRVSIPSNFGSNRVANRLDISCLPAYAADILSIKIFDGTTWKLLPGWPQISTINGINPRPMVQVGPLRCRFPDQVVAGIEVTLKPSYGLSEQGFNRYPIGLYHLGLYYDPIAWSQPSQAYTVVESSDLPPYPVRIKSVTPEWLFAGQESPISIDLYRITGSGSWVRMGVNDVVAGEGVGIVLTLRPIASEGWGNVLRGIRLQYEPIS